MRAHFGRFGSLMEILAYLFRHRLSRLGRSGRKWSGRQFTMVCGVRRTPVQVRPSARHPGCARNWIWHAEEQRRLPGHLHARRNKQHLGCLSLR